jgi:diacylglycerol O-acyltransferase / wax synthase
VATLDPQSRYERLSGADVTNLLAERPGTPWHIGLIGVLDGDPLIAPDGSLQVDLVRDALTGALQQASRLRQVVRRTRPGQGRPVWVDAGDVNLDRHVRVVPVPPPGDEPTFLHCCETVLAPAMDRLRPLWDLTLLPGLAEGRVGVVVRLHHALADGAAAIRLVQAMFDGPPLSPTGHHASAPAPSGCALAVDAWRVRAAGARALLRRPPVRGLATSVGALGSQLAALAHPPEPVPQTSLTRPIGHGRRLALLRVPLGPVHAVAHVHTASINDAVLAAVAGGLRAVLASRGEPADVTLRASVPVSLRAAQPGPGGLGNRVGVLLVPLPLREPDALRRMELIAGATRQEKVRARQAGPLAVMTTTLGIRLALPLLRRQRLVSVFVTNVPGPTTPLRLAGAKLLRAYPAAPIAGNVTVGVGVLSYAGDLGLGLTADADAWPDLPVFVDALRESFDALTDSTRQ